MAENQIKLQQDEGSEPRADINIALEKAFFIIVKARGLAYACEEFEIDRL